MSCTRTQKMQPMSPAEFSTCVLTDMTAPPDMGRPCPSHPLQRKGGGSGPYHRAGLFHCDPGAPWACCLPKSDFLWEPCGLS